MFTEQEKRLIKKYCLLPRVSIAFLIMALLIGFVWILLVMINDMVFKGDFYMLGLYAYLGVTIVYTVAFIVCFLIPRIGMRKEKWKQIVKKANVAMSNNDYSSKISATLGTRAAGALLNMSDDNNVNKAGDALNAMAAVGTVATVSQMTNEISKNAKLVASVSGVEIPKAKKYIISIILLPILLLTLVYIPQYMTSKQNTDAGIALASKSVYALQTSLKQDCDHVSIDDPKEEYSDNGYQVTGYLYDYEEPHNAYISVTVGNDGLINDVRYSVGIDLQVSKEKNLKKAELDLLKLNVMMNDSGVKALSYDLLEEYTLPEEFQSQFKSISYYEDLSFQKDENMSVNYMTDSEEEYDEYSESYIYISIKSDKS